MVNSKKHEQVSLVKRQYEVSKLLLEEGANPLDCDR
jgi:hypothetical protein